MKQLPCSMAHSGASVSTPWTARWCRMRTAKDTCYFISRAALAEVYVDGCAIPLGPGQAVAVNPWQAHYYHQPVPGEQTLALVLYIRPAWFRNAIGSPGVGVAIWAHGH